MNINKFRITAVVGVFAIGAILALHGYWVYQMWQYKEQDFSQKVKVTLYQVAKNLANLSGSVLPNTNLINQVSPSYFVVNINDKIQFDQLEYFLKKEFQAASINEDIEYGIFDCSSTQMVYGAYIPANYQLDNYPEKKSVLPTHEDFTYYFGVLFPHKSLGIISNMKSALFITLLIILAIIAYLYSIVIILRQKELSELQKDFINNMTHEFKTPLSSIKLAANSLLSNPKITSDTRLNRFSEIVDDQSNRLNSHIERILNLATIEKNQFLINKENVDVNEIIEQIIPAVTMRLDALGGKIILDLQPDLPKINADKIHLANVFDNLIDNSIKYSLEAPEIIVTSSFEKNKVVIKFIDKGIGMDQAALKKVFNKFYRVHTGNVHNVKGFGLGLFYVKNICDSHQWTIQIFSNINQGTTIQIQMNLG